VGRAYEHGAEFEVCWEALACLSPLRDGLVTVIETEQG